MDSPPRDHYRWQPHRRPELLEQEVARYLKSRVAEKKDCRAQAVLGTGQVEILFHSGDFGVADVSTVEEREQIQQGQHGNQAQVHLAECLAWIDVGDIDSIAAPIRVVMLAISLSFMGDMSQSGFSRTRKHREGRARARKEDKERDVQ